MKVTRLQTMAIRALVLGAIVAGTAGVAVAQKVKPAGPPVSTKGAVKSNPKADKGQATAAAARADARDRKAEKSAVQSARHEPKSLLKGIKLTDAEKQSTRDIEKKYDAQFKEMEKADKVADKAGTPDASFVAKMDVLRMQERAELRAALTPAQQVEFDRNVATLGAKKG